MLKRTLPIVVAMFALFAFIGMSERPSSNVGQIRECQKFPETGYTICGKFLDFWNEHGGLPIFGYPLSNEFFDESDVNGESYEVQYFERALFELHPENQPPYDVQLAQIGTCHYKDKYPTGNPFEGQRKTVPLISDVSYELFPKVEGSFEEFGSYPDMQDVHRFAPDADHLFSIRFETNDSVDTVHAFYQKIIDRQGWKKFGDNWQSISNYYLGDYGQSNAYAYEMWYWVQKSNVSPGKTSVDISIEKALPMIPGASNISSDGVDFEFEQRRVVYRTIYIPDEIYAFYRDILVKDGWQFTGYGSYDTLRFKRAIDGRNHRTSLSVTVTRGCSDRPYVSLFYYYGR